ncbi:MAG: TspO/MBR family protein [bacterium]|nr:TspO/MBR family protein [bacterium]
MNFKKIIKYVICLIPWFLSSLLFSADTSYYKTLNLPWFAPSSIVFPIAWTILYILIAYSIYLTIDKADREYKIILAVNYILNQLFTFSFFGLKNIFVGFINTLAVFLTSLFLYEATKKINKKASYFLIPYLLWGGYATILLLTIYFLNR